MLVIFSVIPASNLQLASSQTGDQLQTIAMTNSGTGGNAIVHYAPGNSDGQLIVPGKLSLHSRRIFYSYKCKCSLLKISGRRHLENSESTAIQICSPIFNQSLIKNINTYKI